MLNAYVVQGVWSSLSQERHPSDRTTPARREGTKISATAGHSSPASWRHITRAPSRRDSVQFHGDQLKPVG